MKTKLFNYIIGIFLLQGCAMQVGTLNPYPKLNLSKTDYTLSLLIGENINNTFLIPEYSGIKKSKVANWHETLKVGYKNGFGNYFILVEGNLKSDYIIKLDKTELSFKPLTVSGYNNTTELNVEIKFRALLLNKEKEILNSIDGIAESNKSIKIKGQEKEAIENAVENMYQIIASKFFKK